MRQVLCLWPDLLIRSGAMGVELGSCPEGHANLGQDSLVRPGFYDGHMVQNLAAGASRTRHWRVRGAPELQDFERYGARLSTKLDVRCPCFMLYVADCRFLHAAVCRTGAVVCGPCLLNSVLAPVAGLVWLPPPNTTKRPGCLAPLLQSWLFLLYGQVRQGSGPDGHAVFCWLFTQV